MIVVADTTPLRYLVIVERQHLLPALYGRVLIPPAVADELDHENAPEAVRAWLAARLESNRRSLWPKKLPRTYLMDDRDARLEEYWRRKI